VMNCQNNFFVLEDIGTYDSDLEGTFYRSAQVEKLIVAKLLDKLRSALTDFCGNDIFQPVEHIKIIVKQLQGLNKCNLSGTHAGPLTQTTFNAVKTLVDTTFSSESHVLDTKEKTGITYIRTEVATGRKLYLLKSTGKHLNAVMLFLDWFGEHAKRLIEKGI